MIRPKKIDLLISHREGRLVPQPTKVEGDLVLWDGPLGKTVGGTHPELFEEVDLAVHRSDTHFARSMRTASRANREILVDPARPSKAQVKNGETITQTAATTNKEVLEWFKWDSIGAACDPQCGGCKCGRCPPGGKEMTLGEERDLEKIKECLTYVLADKYCETPHWDAAYPWKGDPVTSGGTIADRAQGQNILAGPPCPGARGHIHARARTLKYVQLIHLVTMRQEGYFLTPSLPINPGLGPAPV